MVDQEVQDRRDAALSALEKQSEGKRGQPPMLFRLRVVLALVDRRRAEGVPFDYPPEQPDEQACAEDLNNWRQDREIPQVSPQTGVRADAVRYILRQIKGLID